MKIKFSRYAKRRGKLYKISEETVKDVLKKKTLLQGNHELTENVDDCTYPPLQHNQAAVHQIHPQILS
ncbi:MAG: hypothetical protein J7L16_04280 [Deltaproteobacteria bacterium]|nr:hypothetical protein [Deltaproteobacteria bacterium]